MRMVCVLLVTVLFGSSCISSGMIANNMPPVISDMEKAFYRERSPAHAAAAAPSLLSMLDGFLISSPDNTELLISGASMNCGYAFTFVEDKDKAWAEALYTKGLEYAIRALREDDPRLAAAVAEGDDSYLSEALANSDEDLARGIFWAGLCMGGRLGATMKTQYMPQLSTAQLLLARSLELDEHYYFASAHLFFGILYGGRTKMLGGEADKGRFHFERHIELNHGRFLLGKLLYARTFAVANQDLALFDRLLQEILDTAPQDDPADMRLVNALAREKAVLLRESRSALFPGISQNSIQAQDPEEDSVSPDEDLGL